MFIELYGRECEPGRSAMASAPELCGYLRSIERGVCCGIER